MAVVRLCRVWSVFVALLIGSSGGQHVQAQCDTWQPFVANGDTGVGTNANCLTVWNGDLVVGGNFVIVGGAQRDCIVRWDGTAWHSFTSGGQTGVESPFGTQVLALTVFSGRLIAGGRFDTAGGQTVNNIARWDDAAWQPLTSGGETGVNSSGVSPQVYALTVYNSDLIAGGYFPTAGG